MSEILLDPADLTVAGDVESLVFDPDSSPVDITDNLDYVVEEFAYTPARPKTEWAESADTDGGLPTNDDHYTNAEATLRIRVKEQASKDAALDAIRAVISKAQKARRSTDGIPVEWTPAGSNRVGTLYLLEADDWNVPITPDGDDFGYSVDHPVFTVHLTFAPFIYGATVTESAVTINEPVESDTINVLGDVRTPGTVVVQDAASEARRQFTFGIGTDLTSPLYYGGTSLVITNTSSTRVADSDAYTGGTVVNLNGLFPGYQDFFSLSDLPNEGTFRVIVRAKATTDEEEVQLRLNWRVGNGPWVANVVAVVAAFSTAAFTEVDLGTVFIPANSTPTLDLLVQARSDVVTGSSEGVRADEVELLPVDRYGRVEGEDVITGGQTLATYDGFSHDSGSALDGTDQEFQTGGVAAGNDWEGAGDSQDFVIVSGPTGGFVRRQPTAADADLNTGRYAVVGGTLAATTAITHFRATHWGKSTGQETRAGVLARYVDANNWLGAFVRVRRNSAGNYTKKLSLYKRVAGTVTKLKEVDILDTKLTASRGMVEGALSLVVSGTTATVYVGRSTSGEPTDQAFSVTDAVLGTALDDGRAGIYQTADFGDGSNVEGVFSDITVYSTVTASTATYAIPDDGSLTLTDGEALDSTSNPIPLYGSGFVLEPGDRRLAFKTRRNSTGEADTGLSDGGTITVSYRPAYLATVGA